MSDKLLHKMTIFLLAIILFIPLIEVHAQEMEVIVDTSSLKVRSGPGLTYDIIGAVQKGDKLVVIGKENDWYQINYGTTTGWVASWYTTGTAVEMTNKQAISKVNKLNIRTEPSLSSAVIGQLQEGEQFTSYKSEGEWIEISYNDRKGWVHSDYVTFVEQSDSQENQEQAVFSNEYFTVSVDILNVRSKADLSSDKIGQVARNQQFKVLSKVHNWVQIELENGEKGWLYTFYGNFTGPPSTASSSNAEKSITILYNGTNLRAESTTNSEVVARVDAGKSFSVLEEQNDWYKIKLTDGSTAYVASWVVSSTGSSGSSNSPDTSTNSTESPATPTPPVEKRKSGTLKGLTIVVDAGHGGNDRGTTGALGTDEKDITLLTAELLSSKLQAAGANVIMSRESDVYVDLRKRVSIGHQAAADAFISLHYDAVDNSSVRGFTTYYMHDYQKKLASYVHKELGNMVDLKDRGTQPGNYLILRENRQKAILIELGYLSNPTEERNVTTAQFREQATRGIYNGIINYFDSQIK